jgi:predicted short-subunit dehydrogenase-like oxidoreductase (DUF2520 family)
MKKTLAIIGAGRVGRALGRLLREQGWRIGAVATRSRATARAAARAIGEGRAEAAISPAAFGAEVILISAPDRAITGVAAELARVGAALRRPFSPDAVGRQEARRGMRRGGADPPLPLPIVLHTSGSLSHRALAPLAKLGCATAAMHPMQTFSHRASPNLKGVVFGIDGDARAVRVARGIARSLGGIPVVIRADRKAAYHCAGGFAAPHLLAAMEAGTRVLMSAGFPRRQAYAALRNLAQQTLENVAGLGPRGAWTGPLSRGDFGTIAKHMQVLHRFPPEYAAAYAALARLLARQLAAHPGALLRRLRGVLRDPRS